MKVADIDTSQFPVVIIKLKETKVSETEFDEYLEAVKQVYEQNHDFVVIYDSSEAGYMPSNLRIKQGAWLKENRDLIKSRIFGASYVLANTMAKVLLKGIFLLQKPLWENKITSSRGEAFAWAKQILAKNGVEWNYEPDETEN